VPITGEGHGFYDQNGNIIIPRLSHFSRTYAHATAGVIKLMNYKQESRVFKLVYTVRAAIKQPTDIFLNTDLHYTAGYTVTVSSTPARQYTWKPSSAPNHVLIIHPSDAKDGDSVSVVITPK